MTSNLRIFLAIDLSISIRSCLATIQENLEKAGDSVKWVKPENMHLTLKFIGKVRPTQIESINTTLECLFNGFHPFGIKLTSLDGFPNRKNPHIIWVGLHDRDQTLIPLAASIESALASLGIEKSSKLFNPHVTIGRVRPKASLGVLSKKLEDYPPLPKIGQTIEKAALYNSTLTARGPVYKALKIFHFSGE